MEIKDLKIDYVHFNKNNISIGWSADIGFGILTIHQDNNDFTIETECLGQEFYKQIIEKFKEYLLQNYKIIE